MSKLEELIVRLCPDGVEYKSLGEIGKICMCKRILKSQTNASGGVPFFKIGTFGKKEDAYISFELFDEYKRKYSYPKKGDILISAAGTIGRTVVFDGNPAYFQDSNIVWIDNDESKITNSFLFYFYDTKPWNVSEGGTIPRLYNDSLAKIKVPVPPLEVQREIVHILDSFTLLTAELAAELAARQKQYEFYRDMLLTFDDVRAGGTNIEWHLLGDVCHVIAGGTPSKKNMNYWHNGTIKWLGSTVCQNQKTVDQVTDYITEEGLENSSAKLISPNSTLIALVGATIGKVAYLPFEASINQNIAAVYPKDTHVLHNSYVYYVCTTLYPKFLALTQGSKLAMANLTFVRNLKIPVPPLSEQQRIVDILDRFDALCNDITSGLPAEIEARKKQYEYYRDKLLTFKELKKEA